MRNILLTVSYDGTDFCGWQRQDDVSGGEAFRTVQGELEKALQKLCHEKVSVYGSGRTDSGVHAFAQAANFYSPLETMPASNYVRAVNAFLPSDVRITAAREVPQDFSARKNATSRVYRYFISFDGTGGDTQPGDTPAVTSQAGGTQAGYSQAGDSLAGEGIQLGTVQAGNAQPGNGQVGGGTPSAPSTTSVPSGIPANDFRYSWYVKNYEPNLGRLNALCSCLRGELDCSSFCASGDESLSMNRYIDDAHFFMQKNLWGNELLVFQIEANAFLWKMVRTLTGTLVNLDKACADDDALSKILAAKDRTRAGVTAPPQGLFLYEIKFDGVRRHE